MTADNNDSKKRKGRGALIAAGALSSAALALAFSGTLAGFTAKITNSNNTLAMGSLIMQETSSDNSVTCKSNDTTATCAGINKYGGKTDLKPGDSTTVPLTIENIGTITPTSFTVQGGPCTQTAAGVGNTTDFCSKVNVVIKVNSTEVYNGTAAGLAGTPQTINVVATPNEKLAVTVTTSTSSDLPDAYQGAALSQPLIWTFNAAN